MKNLLKNEEFLKWVDGIRNNKRMLRKMGLGNVMEEQIMAKLQRLATKGDDFVVIHSLIRKEEMKDRKEQYPFLSEKNLHFY